MESIPSAGTTVAIAMLLGGILLVAAATPRFLAGLAASEPLAMLEPRARAPLATRSAAELNEADRRLATAEDSEPGSHQVLQARAVILNMRAARAAPEDRARLLVMARQRAAAAVAAAPARSDAWGRLLMAEYALHGPSPTALAALRLSYETGRHEPQPRRLRLLVGLRHWDMLRPDLRELTRRQLADMWRGRFYAELAWVDTRILPLGRGILRALAPDDEARKRFDRTLRRALRTEQRR